MNSEEEQNEETTDVTEENTQDSSQETTDISDENAQDDTQETTDVSDENAQDDTQDTTEISEVNVQNITNISEDDVQDTMELVGIKDALPDTLHILPLANRPFFPHQVIPLIVDNEPWAETIKEITDSSHKLLGLILVKTENVSDAKIEDFYTMGTVCRLHRVVQAEDKLQVVVEGLQRFHIEEWLVQESPLFG